MQSYVPVAKWLKQSNFKSMMREFKSRLERYEHV